MHAESVSISSDREEAISKNTVQKRNNSKDAVKAMSGNYDSSFSDDLVHSDEVIAAAQTELPGKSDGDITETYEKQYVTSGAVKKRNDTDNGFYQNEITNKRKNKNNLITTKDNRKTQKIKRDNRISSKNSRTEMRKQSGISFSGKNTVSHKVTDYADKLRFSADDAIAEGMKDEDESASVDAAYSFQSGASKARQLVSERYRQRSVMRENEQKRQIKKAYAKAKRGQRASNEAEREASKAVTTLGDRIGAFLENTATKDTGWGKVLVIVLIILLAFMLMGPVLTGAAGAGAEMILTTYPSSDEDIYAAENAYRALESSLQSEMTMVSTLYPGYFEYELDMDEIGHDPYVLISYLTTYCWDFEYEDVEEEVNELFKEQYSITITPEVRNFNGQQVTVLKVKLENHGLENVAALRMDDEQKELYDVLVITKGNRDYLFNESNTSWGYSGSVNYSASAKALSDVQFSNMLREAQKYLGWPYVWGGSSPSDGGFDCSGYVCWVINNCGNGWNIGRTTAEGLRQKCVYVSPEDARPGDLVFFEGTYNTTGASHVGIYLGDGIMINAGDPIKYADINSSYWSSHFMQFGRLPDAHPTGNVGYTNEDRELLASAIWYEARGCSFAVQTYVGQVIMNRVNDSRFPNTVRGVLSQSGQYVNGTKSAPEPCYAAADAVLNGEVAMPSNVIYQANFRQGTGVWKYAENLYFCYG